VRRLRLIGVVGAGLDSMHDSGMLHGNAGLMMTGNLLASV
jgi:hypothetical protein